MAYAKCSFNLCWSRLIFLVVGEELLKCVMEQMLSETTKKQKSFVIQSGVPFYQTCLGSLPSANFRYYNCVYFNAYHLLT